MAQSRQGRKRKAEAQHSIVQMCLTSGRRAFLSFTWAAKLLQSPKRLRTAGGQVPWGGFIWLQYSYLHHALIGGSAARKASDPVGRSMPPGAQPPGRREDATLAAAATAAPPRRAARSAYKKFCSEDFVDLTLSDSSDGTDSPERGQGIHSAANGLRRCAAASQPISASIQQAPTVPLKLLASLSVEDDDECGRGSYDGSGGVGGRGGVRDRSGPAALLVARTGTPLLTALRAQRPQPKPAACVATITTGPTNLQPLTAGDLSRLLAGDGWLNDEVVNFYMMLILKRNAQLHSLGSGAGAAAEGASPTAAGAIPSRSAALGIPQSALPASGFKRATAAAQLLRRSDPLDRSGPGPAAKPGGAAPLRATKASSTAAETLPGPASPLQNVMAAIAAAAGSSGSAAAAAAVAAASAVATTAAGLGAVMTERAKRLAQRQRRGEGHAAAAMAAAEESSGGSSMDMGPSRRRPSSWDPGSVSCLAQSSQLPRQRPTPRQQQLPFTVYAFNSFFFSKLTGKGNRKCFAYDEVRRWTQPCRTHTPDCVLTRDLLLFPINHGNAHWCLAAVWPRCRLLQYFDSLGGSRAIADWVLDTLLRWLLTDAEDKGVTLGSAGAHGSVAAAAAGPSLTAIAAVTTRRAYRGAAGAGPSDAGAGWRKESLELRIPKQLDGSSCGVFACSFAELLARGVSPDAFGFSQAELPNLRRGMAEQILRGAL